MDRHPALRDRGALRAQIDECHREKARAQGQKQTLEDRVREYERELRSKMYKNAEVQHREKLIELKTTQMANDDLEKYSNALDR